MISLSASRGPFLSLLAVALLGLGACTSDRAAPTAPADVDPEQLLTSTYNPFSAVPVGGTWSGGTFVGTYTVLKFVVVDGKLKAEVKLKGKIKTFAGAILSYVDVKLLVPVKVIDSRCSILKLELGVLVKVLAGKTVTLSKCLVTVDPAKASLAIVISLKLVLCNITSALGGALSLLVSLLNQCLGLFKCGLLSCLL
ncbi:MAG TPA: hypothetical protein VM094_00485 [Gemmatimonadales bacterium]|nr:hypothetical protein [Gemmatimonadales bacterium]